MLLMHRRFINIVWLWLILLCHGCVNVLDEHPSRISTEPSLWGLSVGSYYSQGTLTQISDNQWEYRALELSGGLPHDRVIIDGSLGLKISRLNAKPLDYEISNQVKSAVAERMKNIQKKVTYNQLRYTVITCSDWRLHAFSFEQYCIGEMPHTNHKVLNIIEEPLEFVVWLPYLKQTMTLTQL